MSFSQSNNLLNVYLAPSASFENVEKLKSATWLSLTIIVGLIFLSNTLFYSDMSPAWIVEQQMQHMTDLSDNERQQIATYMLESADHIGIISSIVSSLFFLFSTFLLAAYFALIGRASPSLGFQEWFALSVKMQLPLVVNLLVFMLIFLSAGNSEQPISLINYASVNHFVVGLEPGNGYYNLLENLNLFYVWSMLIGAFGLKALLGKGFTKSLLLAGTPYVIFFVTWAISI
jgi:hypothetical protein